MLAGEDLQLFINGINNAIDFTFTCHVNHNSNTIEHFIVSVTLTNDIARYNSPQRDNVWIHSAISLKIYIINVSYLLSNNQIFMPRSK